ncbi:MAG TPA: type II toxin-antitoxin system VapC family toxin [Terriglobales bacterium]|nr:type II toxin-antitoxin system VapC family toxin [Terriglobales bacterium]
MTIYADSSFMVSLYAQDGHSATAQELMNSNPRLWFSPLHLAECFHAIAQQVFYRRISAADAQAVYRHLKNDQTSGLWAETSMPENAFALCADLARRYGPKLGIRTLDSLHVACALELKAEQFWTFDERQVKLAKAVGLKTT